MTGVRERGGRSPGDLDEALSAYLDGELPPEEAAALREILEESPEARRRLEEFGRVDDALGALASRDVPVDLRDRLRARIAAEARVRSRTPGRGRRAAKIPRPRRRWLLPGAVSAAALALGLLLLVSRLREDSGPGLSPPRSQSNEWIAQQGDSVREFLEPEAGFEAELAEAIGSPTPREIAVLRELESSEDLAVLELLEWLDQLEELEPSERG